MTAARNEPLVTFVDDEDDGRPTIVAPPPVDVDPSEGGLPASGPVAIDHEPLERDTIPSPAPR